MHLERILNCTFVHAEYKKNERGRGTYELFIRKKAEIVAFLGALILLGVHSVRNHRKAWSVSKAQHLTKLHDLMTCQRFEIIGCFLHVVTPSEEEAAAGDHLRKLRPFLDHLKFNCFTYYQPLQNLRIDERIVKSKSRSHIVQYALTNL